MNIFFDCDYTILSADQVLRPGTHEAFARLSAAGHQLYLWSGEGARWSVVRQHGLAPYLHGVFPKPLQDFDAGLHRFGIEPEPDFVVDDYPQIVRHFGGFHIREFYLSSDGPDGELDSVCQAVAELGASGRASHPRWMARTAGTSTNKDRPAPATLSGGPLQDRDTTIDDHA